MGSCNSSEVVEEFLLTKNNNNNINNDNNKEEDKIKIYDEKKTTNKNTLTNQFQMIKN